MSEKLKPCPFCGGANIKAHVYGQNIGGEPDAFCQCHDCTTTGPCGTNEIEAIAAWNRRANGRIADLERKNTELDRAITEVITERDRAQDALLEASEAMGGPEWCAKIPPEPAPDSGDLHDDVPELCRQLVAEKAELERQNAELRKDAERLAKVVELFTDYERLMDERNGQSGMFKYAELHDYIAALQAGKEPKE